MINTIQIVGQVIVGSLAIFGFSVLLMILSDSLGIKLGYSWKEYKEKIDNEYKEKFRNSKQFKEMKELLNNK